MESGNVNAYVATYSPEHHAGYYAITTDQGFSIEEALAQAPPVPSLAADIVAPRDAPELPHATIAVFSRYSRAQIDSSIEQLTKAVESAGIAASFYFEASSDSIVLTTDLSDGFQIPPTDVEIDVTDGSVSSALFAENMRSPFRGGGTIYNNSGGRCTSGIPAFNANGGAGYFTAAHCFSLSSVVYSSTWLSGTSITGTVSHRYGINSVDAEFVSGSTYNGSVFVTDTTSLRISGTYFPSAGQGNALCFSGSTMGKRCDNDLITYAGHVCYDIDSTNYCWNDMIALRGGTSVQPGDSGGPVYGTFGSSLKVTGIVAALQNPVIGESTSFVTDWRQIASRYSATLMTS